MDSQGCCAPVSLQPLCFSTVDEPTKTHHIVTRSRSEDHTWKEIGRESSPRLQDPPYFTKRLLSRPRSTNGSHVHNRKHRTNAFWFCLARPCNLHPQSPVRLHSFSLIFFLRLPLCLVLFIIIIHTWYSVLICVGLFPFDLGVCYAANYLLCRDEARCCIILPGGAKGK